MTTAADLILQSLKISGVVGVGQDAQADDLADSLFQVNLILGQWSRKRWLNTDLIDVVFISTGAQSYSIGTGADINTVRPDKISSAFFRTGFGPIVVPDVVLPGAYDYPLAIIQAREDYNAIGLKGLGTWPQAIFYDSAYPVGRVFVWPIPAIGAFEIHLSLKVGIPQIADATQPIGLPNEYLDALLWSLAARLRPMYGLPPEPTIIAAMTAALNTIRVANSQVGTLGMPPALSGGRGMSLGSFIGGQGIY